MPDWDQHSYRNGSGGGGGGGEDASGLRAPTLLSETPYSFWTVFLLHCLRIWVLPLGLKPSSRHMDYESQLSLFWEKKDHKGQTGQNTQAMECYTL